VFRSSPSLLVRGDPAAVDAARARIAELDRVADLLAIDLEVVLEGAKPAPGSAGSAGSNGSTEPKPEHLAASRRVASGEEAVFGSRVSTSFVMSFDVEVAADSGIASPVLGSACTGRTLHVRAARVEGGRRVRIEGLLDLADLRSIERFDPETADLGIVQEPAIDLVQVAFAGVVEPGKALEVKIAGAPLPLADWSLAIRATTKPEGVPTKPEGATSKSDPAAESGKDALFDVLDLGGLASSPLALAAASPGAVLDRQAPFVPSAPAIRAGAPIPPSAIAAALDTRGSDGSGGRPSIAWSDDLLVLRRSDAGVRADARALVAAAEVPRLSARTLEVKRGGLAATIPACAGSPARLLVGRERTALVGYRVQIAPQTWMAAPEVVKVFDGFCLDADVVAGAADCSLWVADSRPSVVAPRKDAQIGKLEILSRSLRSDRGRLGAGEPERALAPRPPETRADGKIEAVSDSVLVRCVAP
jgi:hypothetical protein